MKLLLRPLRPSGFEQVWTRRNSAAASRNGQTRGVNTWLAGCIARATGWIVTVSGILFALGCGGELRTVTLGGSTTVMDSGLLEELRSGFEAANPSYRLRIVTGGSGELLEVAARGDADVTITHSPRAELEFMKQGHGVSRRPVMFNDFVVVGPPEDPAGIRGMVDAPAALARIASSEAGFVSRADDSGTHRKERELWAASGASAGWSGYREMGAGMAAVLRAASELGSYALSDRGTYLSLAHTLRLQVLAEGDERLLNVYSVIVAKRGADPEAAEVFARWITSDAGGRLIDGYGVDRFGQPLYRSLAGSEAGEKIR